MNDKYIKEYEEMNYYDLADELVEPLFSVKQNEAKTIYVHYAKERDKNEQLQKQNAELIKTKNEALRYIQNYNHMNLRYQNAEAKEKLNHIKNILNGREDYHDKLQNNWNELNKFIEEEKNRLATQVSNTYEDSLGKRRFVNEDIFNELTKVSEKMQELEQGKDD